MSKSTRGSNKKRTKIRIDALVKGVTDHPSLVIALAPFLLVGVRLLGVTRGQIDPALFVLAHGDKFSLLLGTFLPWIPILSLCFALLLTRLKSSGTSDEETSRSPNALHVFGFALFAALAGFFVSITSTLTALLLVGFSFNLRGIRASLFFWVKKWQGKDHRVFREDGIPFFLLIVLVLSLLLPAFPTTRFWLPSEDVLMNDGQIHSGIVLSTDTRFSYILTKDLIPEIIDNSRIQQRTPCRIQKILDLPIRFYIDGERYLILKVCHETTHHVNSSG